jgi:hypothetical protein
MDACVNPGCTPAACGQEVTWRRLFRVLTSWFGCTSFQLCVSRWLATQFDQEPLGSAAAATTLPIEDPWNNNQPFAPRACIQCPPRWLAGRPSFFTGSGCLPGEGTAWTGGCPPPAKLMEGFARISSLRNPWQPAFGPRGRRARAVRKTEAAFMVRLFLWTSAWWEVCHVS